MKRYKSLFARLFFIILLVSCKGSLKLEGLPDAKVPTCKVVFPKDECPVIRNSFRYRGIAHDDGDIEEVKLLLRSSSHSAIDLEFPCSIEKKGDVWEWEVSLNIPNKDNSFPIKDGKYNVIIVAKDKDGKIGKAESSLIVDNTPPLLFLQSPAFLSNNEEEPYPYGDSINLKGLAYDDSPIKNLDFFSYANKKWEKARLDNIDFSFDVRLDSFFSPNMDRDGIYRRLYGSSFKAGTKVFPYVISLVDSAKEYESPTSNGKAEEGNKSLSYYLYEALYTKDDGASFNIFPRYTLEDIYNMMRGTFAIENNGKINSEKEKERLRVLSILEAGTLHDGKTRFAFSFPSNIEELMPTKENNDKFSYFALNPLKSPTIEVISLNPSRFELPSSQGLAKNTNNDRPNLPIIPKRRAGDVLKVRLAPAVLGTPLEDASKFEFYYCELSSFFEYYDSKGFLLSPNNKEGSEVPKGLEKIVNVPMKKEGEGYVALVPIETSLKLGSSYILFIRGKDKKENSLIVLPSLMEDSKDGTYYAYAINVVGETPPSSLILTDLGSLYGNGKDEIKEDIFIKANQELNFKALVTSQSYPVKLTCKLQKGDIELFREERLIKVEESEEFFNIKKTKVLKANTYTLSFELTEEHNKILEKFYTLKLDEDAPKLEISDFPSLVGIFPKIFGTFYDEGVGVLENELKVQVSYNKEKRRDVAIEFLESKDKIKWELGDFLHEKEGEYQLFFNAKDRLGNEMPERIVEIKYDKNSPLLLELNDYSIEELQNMPYLELKYFSDIHAVGIGGKIKESNGLKEIKIGIKDAFDGEVKTFHTSVPRLILASQDTYSFLQKLDFKKEGKSYVVLKIFDNAGRESTYEVAILLDRTPPQFKKVKMGLKDFESFSEPGRLDVVSTNLPINVEAFDEGSGIAKLLVYEKTAEKESLIKTIVPTKDKNSLFFLQSNIPLNIGEHILNFVLYDNLGRTSEWSCMLNVQNPSSLDLSLEVTGQNTFINRSTSTMAFKGSFELIAKGITSNDKSNFDLELVITKDGLPIDNFTLSNLLPSLKAPLKCEGGRVKGLKSYNLSNAKEEKLVFKVRPTGDDDGFYVFTLLSTGKEKSIAIVVDNKGPNIRVLQPFLRSSMGAIWLNKKTCKIKGLVEDDGCEVGILKIRHGEKELILDGKSEWEVDFELLDGENIIKFFAEDKLKNKSLELEKKIIVDREKPNLQVLSSNDGQLLVGISQESKKVLVKAKDEGAFSSGIRELRYSNKPSFATSSVMEETEEGFLCKLPRIFKDSSYYFWALDNAGNISDAKELKLVLDKIPPKLELDVFPSIGNLSYVNNKVNINLSFADDFGIEDIFVKEENGSEIRGFKKHKWDFIGKTEGKASCSFDSNLYPDSSKLKILITALDIAGNKTTKTLNLNIKQDSDLPMVTILEQPHIKNISLGSNGLLFGNVEDDDGIKSFSIKVGSEPYKELYKGGGDKRCVDWNYQIPLGTKDGFLPISFRVLDALGKTFESDAKKIEEKVKLRGEQDEDVVYGKFNIPYNTKPPQFSSKGLLYTLEDNDDIEREKKYSECGNVLGKNIVINAKANSKISFRCFAKDEMLLKNAVLRIGRFTKNISLENNIKKEDGFDVLDFNDIDIKDIGEGGWHLTIEVSDTFGLSSIYETVLIFDFTSPKIEMITDIDSIFFDKVSLRGKMQDIPNNSSSSISGVDEYSLQYKIGESPFIKVHKDGDEVLSKIENSIATWRLDIPNIAKYAKLDEAGYVKYGAIKLENNVWLLPLTLKVCDKAGNEYISKEYNIKFDVRDNGTPIP